MDSRIKSIDIIRGIAAISVFLTHLGNDIHKTSALHSVVKGTLSFQQHLLWCNGGLHWAVIVFIVLSGFCIHMPTAKRQTTDIILPYYARRRFFRIYPVLVLAVLLGYLVHALTSPSGASYGLNLLWNLSLSSGVMSYLSPPLGNEILLTVIVECLLYALYPLCLPKQKKHWIWLLAVGALVYLINISFLIVLKLDPVWLQRNLFAFFVYWWIGAFFAELTFNPKEWSFSFLQNTKWMTMALTGMYVLYVIMGFVVRQRGTHFLKSLYLAVLAGFFLYWIVSIERKLKQKVGSKITHGMATTGEYSYSLYVVHLPIIALLNSLMASYFPQIKHTATFYLLHLALVFLGAFLFYHLVEKPSHQYAKTSSDRVLQELRQASK